MGYEQIVVECLQLFLLMASSNIYGTPRYCLEYSNKKCQKGNYFNVNFVNTKQNGRVISRYTHSPNI